MTATTAMSAAAVTTVAMTAVIGTTAVVAMIAIMVVGAELIEARPERMLKLAPVAMRSVNCLASGTSFPRASGP